MKKIVISLLLLTLSFRLSAQIDYLEPVKPFTTYTGELGEYGKYVNRNKKNYLAADECLYCKL